ncbi:hypothetical protein Tco_1392372 [Tanacetum coccineum]
MLDWYEHVAMNLTRHRLTAAAVGKPARIGFKRISLTEFRSCTSHSHYRSVSKQTTRSPPVTAGSNGKKFLTLPPYKPHKINYMVGLWVLSSLPENHIRKTQSSTWMAFGGNTRDLGSFGKRIGTRLDLSHTSGRFMAYQFVENGRRTESF